MSLPNIRVDLRVAILYMIFGGAWILISNLFLGLLDGNLSIVISAKSLEDWIFMLASALLVFLLAQRDLLHVSAAAEALQRSNANLLQAYDTTIEGWSRALDLRDKETEYHALRVTEMTLRLARTAGMRADELVHLRRGVLLHDIGKVGIPDSILFKSSPLTEEEWAIMRQHPIFAYELLSPIEYLRPALDIPYCHHEKWNGSGYPRGLKGEQIPLAARLFAVVDVWDALLSDRPYRKGMSKEKALEHIRSLSGSHFDPHVVDLFFNIFA